LGKPSRITFIWQNTKKEDATLRVLKTSSEGSSQLSYFRMSTTVFSKRLTKDGKRSTRDQKAEDFWELIKDWE
jgi:hypothetical protein